MNLSVRIKKKFKSVSFIVISTPPPRAPQAACGGSQARAPIGATAVTKMLLFNSYMEGRGQEFAHGF